MAKFLDFRRSPVLKAFGFYPKVTEQASADIRHIINDSGGGGKWHGGLSASGRGASINHYQSRQNARVAMKESVQARVLVERFADTVADTGLRLELTPKAEVLGITLEEAAQWARNVESRFDLWAGDKKQHRSESLNFYQSQHLYQIFQHRDNDIFLRLYYAADRGLQNPLQFSFVDPDQIRGDAYTTTYGIHGMMDGIERDDRGRETKYKIWIRKKDGSFGQIDIPAKGSRSDRIFMLHGYRPEYAGQTRGYSRLGHAIQELENITDFSAATIKKAINQSNIVGFVEPSKDEDAQPIFEGVLTDSGAGPAAEMFGSEASSSTCSTSADPIQSCYRVPEATFDTPGSLWINNLTKGSKITFPANTAPGDSFDKFVDSFFGYLSASTGVPIEVALMKFGQNYSASRATLLLFWRVCNVWRHEMACDYLDPVKEMWLSGEIAAGRIIAPGWSDPRLKAAWLNCNWIGSAPPDIDPTKTANARRMNIETGVTNLDREARDYNGSSAEGNIEKNKVLFEQVPKSPWQVQGGGADVENNNEDDEDND